MMSPRAYFKNRLRIFPVIPIAAAIFLAADARPEFSVTLGYYSLPLKNREWSISVYRQGGEAFIEADNYLNLKAKKRLERETYLRLVDYLNRQGIWRLTDRYPASSRNCYYRIDISAEARSHSFRVEAGPLLSGENSRYREIIRYLTNAVKRATEK
jgi:hypothetical protein